MLYTIVTVLNKVTKMTTTTESGGRQNMFPTETRPYIDESISYESYAKNAEKINGRWAMLGLVAGFISYVTTGNFFFGSSSLVSNHGHYRIYFIHTFNTKQVHYHDSRSRKI